MAKKPSKAELRDLAYKVDNEGFWYYLSSYGPDMELFKRMGYKEQDILAAIAVLNRLELEIMEYME